MSKLSLIIKQMLQRLTGKPALTDQSNENPYEGLRKLALGFTADELGLNFGPNEPYAVVVDMGLPKAVVTLLSVADGSASLYFSNGGGILGGVGHEAVREAAKDLVAISGNYIHQMEKTDVYPLPEVEHVRFYVLTPSSVRTCQALQEDLYKKKSDFWMLFYYADRVLTELRLASERNIGR